MTADEIKLILDTAATFKDVSERDIKKVPALRGKTVINLFYEASTRTRTSFELAGKRLSADVINISTSTQQRGQRRDAPRYGPEHRGHEVRHDHRPAFLFRRSGVSLQNGSKAR